MSTTTSKTAVPRGLDPLVLARILEEGYGPGAWHGPDLRAALSDLSKDLAFWRPGAGRHNIAEVALHHAYCVRSVRTQLTGETPEGFVVPGEDWFVVEEGELSWTRVKEVVEEETGRLAAAVADIGQGRVKSPLSEGERFDLVLGATCHAVYHAGQIQLIKKMRAA